MERVATIKLSILLVLLLSNVDLAQRRKSVPLSSKEGQKFTERELLERFNGILDEKLSADNICVSVAAAHQLDDLMRKGAEEIINTNSFDRLPEAEKNIQRFADELLTWASNESLKRISIRD
jgi:hypothetical protein